MILSRNVSRNLRQVLSLAAVLALGGGIDAVVRQPTAQADDSVAEQPAAGGAREQRVLAFVERHQPELAELLTHLAKRNPGEYDKALADLDRKVLALESDRAKDERLYEFGLRAWRARTEVDLLVARWIAGGKQDRATIEPQLRAALDAELDARAEHLTIRKERSAAWYDRQIVRLRDKREDVVASRLNELLGDQGKKSKPAAAGRR